MFILRNYDRFVVGTIKVPQLEWFYIHRFSHDAKRLVKFENRENAEKFLLENPDLEKEFDLWVSPFYQSDWK